MTKFLLLLSLLFAPVAMAAQVAVSASAVVDASSHPLTNAKLCFTPVDATGEATGFRSGSLQVQPTQVCGIVSNGVLQSGLSVVATPSGIYYRIQTVNRATNAVIRDYGFTQITGSVWTMDTYDPTTAVVPANVLTIGTVTELSPNASPTATITGSSPLLLNIGVPQGATGAIGLPGTNIVSTTVGGAPVVIAGTTVIVNGDSLPAGYGSGNPYAAIMTSSNPLFAGRSTYYNYATIGWTIAQVAADYTVTTHGGKTTKQWCQGATGTAPVYLIVDFAANTLGAGTSASDTFTQASAFWTQARTDGCTVFASTVRPDGNFTGSEEVQRKSYNQLVKGASLGTYNALLDFAQFLPDNSGWAYISDHIHTSLAGDIAEAGYVANVIATGGSAAPSTGTIGQYRRLGGPVSSGNYSVAPFDETLNCSLSATGILNLNVDNVEGRQYTFYNDTTQNCHVYAQDGVPSTIGGDDGVAGIDIPNYGDSLTIEYHGTDWQIVQQRRATPPYVGAVRTLTATSQSYWTDDIVDCDGNEYDMALSYAGIQNAVGHRITLVNSASTSCPIANFMVNGAAGALPSLAQYKTIIFTYLGSTLGWIATAQQ